MIRRLALFLSCLVVAAGAAAAADEPHATIRIGGDVHVSEPASGSLTVVGGQVEVDAPVNGPLHAAGGQIDVGPHAAIAQDASIAGGNITIKGPIHGELRAAGGHITLDGPVDGDAKIAGGSLTLGPDARISGRLDFRGGRLDQDPAAQVTGGIVHKTRGWGHHEPTGTERFTRGWIWTAGLIIIAALIAGALPGPSQRLAAELRERPWLTALAGFLAVTAVPVLAVLLVCTIIGIPIALLAMVVYALLLLVGYVWLAVVVGGLVLERIDAGTAAQTAYRVGAAVLAMLVLAILVRVPYVGGLFKFVALIVGVGMIVGAVLRARQPRATVTAA